MASPDVGWKGGVDDQARQAEESGEKMNKVISELSEGKMNKVISEPTGGQQEQFEKEAEAAIRQIETDTAIQVKIKSYASQKI